MGCWVSGRVAARNPWANTAWGAAQETQALDALIVMYPANDVNEETRDETPHFGCMRQYIVLLAVLLA